MEIISMYTARVIEEVDHGNGYWKTLKVGVFDKEGNQIGEYTRNYSSFYTTFYPFKSEVDNKWYALYSKDYTCTRIMSLPDCKDIGGEDPESCGFCPVEYYVPIVCCQNYNPDTDPHPYNPRHDPDTWAKKVTTDDSGTYYEYPKKKLLGRNTEYKKYKQACDKADKESKDWHERNPFKTLYAPFAFISGCVWGDDCSWKIQYIDLSKAHEGKIVREARFGYIELPSGCSLKDCIDVNNIDNYSDMSQEYIDIGIQKSFRMDGMPTSLFCADDVKKGLDHFKATSVEIVFRDKKRFGNEYQELVALYKDAEDNIIKELSCYG